VHPEDAGAALGVTAGGRTDTWSPKPLTVVGVALGAIGWAVVRGAAKNPAGLLRWLVPVVVVVSFVPAPTLLGGDTSGKGPPTAVEMMMMHVMVGGVAVIASRRVLPLPIH
jgi:hypothetical protein